MAFLLAALLAGSCLSASDEPVRTDGSRRAADDAASPSPAPHLGVSGDNSAGTSAKTKGSVDSTYTELAEDACEDADSDKDEEWTVQKCKGILGYELIVSEGDLRQTIDVVSPAGKKSELDLWNVVSNGFSTVGDKAEWRVTKKNGKSEPFALIVRYNVNEDPDNTEKITSYLTVSKITATGACVTDIVKPSKKANEIARTLADSARKKPCLGPKN
ncbi:MAG: hypothetical protein HKN33_04835 [Pyrinomonadaceae bacterium]|nr:hypothetical protein [Pyrinomonadaceae bacterium]